MECFLYRWSLLLALGALFFSTLSSADKSFPVRVPPWLMTQVLPTAVSPGEVVGKYSEALLSGVEHDTNRKSPPVLTYMLSVKNLGEKLPVVKQASTGAQTDQSVDQGTSHQGNGSSNAAGSNGPPDGGADGGGGDFQNLLSLIDKEMDKYNGIINMTSDMDDTLLPSDGAVRSRNQAMREQFRDFVNKWRDRGKLRLIIITGATYGHSSYVQHLTQFQLPIPDWYISIGNDSMPDASVTVIHADGVTPGEQTVPLEGCLEDISVLPNGFVWGRYAPSLVIGFSAVLSERLKSNQLDIQPHNSSFDMVSDNTEVRFTLTVGSSTDLHSEDTQALIREAVFSLSGVVGVVTLDAGKHEIYVDYPASKGQWLRRLSKVLKLDQGVNFAAGDGDNDKDLIVPPEGGSYNVHTAVVVGNATEGLKEHAQGKPGVFLSSSDYQVGLAQGLLKMLRSLNEPSAD